MVLLFCASKQNIILYIWPLCRTTKFLVTFSIFFVCFCNNLILESFSYLYIWGEILSPFIIEEKSLKPTNL